MLECTRLNYGVSLGETRSARGAPGAGPRGALLAGSVPPLQGVRAGASSSCTTAHHGFKNKVTTEQPPRSGFLASGLVAFVLCAFVTEIHMYVCADIYILPSGRLGAGPIKAVVPRDGSKHLFLVKAQKRAHDLQLLLCQMLSIVLECPRRPVAVRLAPSPLPLGRFLLPGWAVCCRQRWSHASAAAGWGLFCSRGWGFTPPQPLSRVGAERSTGAALGVGHCLALWSDKSHVLLQVEIALNLQAGISAAKNCNLNISTK